MEEWRPIENSEYLISNLGNLKHKNGTPREWITKKCRSGVGSLTTSFYDNDGNYIKPSKISLMKTHWKFEWIKELDDDEEVTQHNKFPDYYISNKGRVFSIKKYKWITPTPYKENINYYNNINYHTKFHIKNNKGQFKNINTSRLMGMVFLPDFDPKLQVQHINEELPPHLVNCVSNLKMGTPKENSVQMIERGRNWMCDQ